MRYIQSFLGLALWAICATTSAFGGDAKVIANSSVVTSSVSVDELRTVFLGINDSLKESGHVQPVLEKDGPAHEAFVKQYLGKTTAALNAYYRSLVFTGKGGFPRTLGSDAEVIAYVAKIKGAIGYVSEAAQTAGVKVLEVK